MFVVLLTGPPGAGKSDVTTALHDALGDDGIATALVEVDELARSYPPLDRARSIEHLRLLSGSFREAGCELLLVTATIEDQSHAAAALEAAGGDAHLLVRLEAEPSTLRRRLEAREPVGWSGLKELVESSQRLARSMARLESVDLVLSTEDRAPDQVAGRVMDALNARTRRDPGTTGGAR